MSWFDNGGYIGVTATFGAEFSYSSSVSFIGDYFINASQTTYNFTTASVGPGLVVVSTHNEVAGGGTIVIPTTGVTIGGVAATLAVQANSGGAAGATSSSLWYAELGSATTSISVNHASAPIRAAIGVHLITNYSSAVPLFTEQSSGSDFPISREVTTGTLLSGVSIVGAYTAGNVYLHTWEGVTERYDINIGGSGSTGGSAVTGTYGSVLIRVTGDATPTQTTSLAVAAWG